jgi:hypothetical protein
MLPIAVVRDNLQILSTSRRRRQLVVIERLAFASVPERSVIAKKRRGVV